MSDKAELKRDGTMQVTTKEGEVFVATHGGLDEDIKTRAQQDQLDKILDEPAAKKLKASNEVSDKEKLIPKRVSTIARTAKEGEELLKELGHKVDDNPDSDRRRTRSQTRGVPPPPLLPKKVRTIPKDNAKPGETKSRGRGRPKKNVQRDENKVTFSDTAKEESKPTPVASNEKDGLAPTTTTNNSSATKDDKATTQVDNKKPEGDGGGKKNDEPEKKSSEPTTVTKTPQQQAQATTDKPKALSEQEK